MRATDLRIGALIAIAMLAYWPTSRGLWHYWTDEHVLGGRGVFATAASLWLLLRARERIAAAPVQSLPRIVPLLGACSIAALSFWRLGWQQLQDLMLPTLILLAVLSAFGAAVTRVIAVPLGFLYFAMPAWDEFLGPPLQGLTLWAVRVLAPAIGIPATVSGTQVLLPGGIEFTVAQGCSGVGFLVEGLAIAALLGELELASAGRRLRLIAWVIPVALAANWIRVLALIDIGYLSGMRSELVTRYHLQFGYVLFVLVLVVFLWIATRGPEAPRRAPPVAEPARRQVGGHYVTALLALVAAPAVVGVLTLLGVTS